jgi:hypothetical protein
MKAHCSIRFVKDGGVITTLIILLTLITLIVIAVAKDERVIVEAVKVTT